MQKLAVFVNKQYLCKNVVYLELLRRGGKIFVGKNNDKEVDFIVQKANNEREYYQVAYTISIEK